MKLPKILRSLKTKWGKGSIADYKLQHVIDIGGHSYYRFPRETNLPIARFSEVMALLERLSSGLSGGEMEMILDKMDAAIAAGLSNPKNASAIATYVHIIRERQSTVIHKDLLINLAAVMLIREDENASIVNPSIHQEKLEAFEAFTKEGAHDFFTRINIEPLQPLLSMSPSEFQMLWDYNRVAQRKLIEALTLVSSHLTTERQGRKTESASK